MLIQPMGFGPMGNNVMMEIMIPEMDAQIIKFLLIIAVPTLIRNRRIVLNARKTVYHARKRINKLNA